MDETQQEKLHPKSMSNMDEHLYDYGFSFEQPETEPKSSNDEILVLMDQHRSLITKEVRQKLKDVEALILPMLANLQKNPDKDYIFWPNRVPIIQQQIDKITSITRSYDEKQESREY